MKDIQKRETWMMSNNLLDIILKHSFDTVPFYIEQKNNLANDFNALSKEN